MMQSYSRPKLNPTKCIPNPSEYIQALEGEFSQWAFSEERFVGYKGEWRQKVFNASDDTPLDLEVGTGNGIHFSHHAFKYPTRMLIGLELKFKPLIQAIRATRSQGCTNARIARYHAANIDQVFAAGELNNVFIHFPDPWTRPRKYKHRIVNALFLSRLHELQRPGSYVDFKTDSREYFLWALEEIKRTPYKVVFQTLNLHQSEMAEQNVITTFERLFSRQGVEINFIRLQKV